MGFDRVHKLAHLVHLLIARDGLPLGLRWVLHVHLLLHVGVLLLVVHLISVMNLIVVALMLLV